MTRAEVDKWTEDNGGTDRQTLFFNGIRYLFVTLPDKWIAIFEDNSGDYIPCIQAANINRAESWCSMRERPRVPFNVFQ